jgi:hypothetical protein
MRQNELSAKEGSFINSTLPQPESITIGKFSELGIVTRTLILKLSDFFSDVEKAYFRNH